MGKINVDLQFTANTQQAKAQLDQLKNSLNQLGNMTNINLGTKTLTNDMIEASNAAIKLKTQLDAATNVNTGKLSLGKFNQELKASGLSLADYRQKLSALGPEGQKAFVTLTDSVISADKAISTGSKLLANFGQTLANVAKYQLSTAVYRGFTQAISTAYNYAQDLNKSLNNIRIVTGQSVEQMDKFAARANKAAKALSTTTTAYTDAALIFYQQGLNDKQVEERTNATIKMANVTGDSVKEVSNQLTAIWNNFAKGGKQLEYYVDVITALGAATASSTSEISEGLEKFAAIAETVGLSYEYATTALATVTAETRQSADVVGTAFKTLFARIQDLELGKTLEDGTTLGKYAQALQTIGVNVKTSTGEVKDMNTILDEMGAKWKQIDDATKIATAQAVAGTRQYAQLMALMENWDTFQTNLVTAQNSEGELDRQAQIYAESWEGARNRVKAALEEIYGALIDDKAFIKMTDGLAGIVKYIGDLVRNMGGLKGVLPMITGLMLQFAGPQIYNGLHKIVMDITNVIPNFKAWSNEIKQAKGFLDKSGALLSPVTLGETRAEGLRKEAITEAQKVYSDDKTLVGDVNRSGLSQRITLQQQLNALSDKLTATEREQAQAMIDRNRLLNDEIEKKAQSVEESRKVVLELTKQKELELEIAAENRRDDQSNFNADVKSLKSMGRIAQEAENNGGFKNSAAFQKFTGLDDTAFKQLTETELESFTQRFYSKLKNVTEAIAESINNDNGFDKKDNFGYSAAERIFNGTMTQNMADAYGGRMQGFYQTYTTGLDTSSYVEGNKSETRAAHAFNAAVDVNASGMGLTGESNLTALEEYSIKLKELGQTRGEGKTLIDEYRASVEALKQAQDVLNEAEANGVATETERNAVTQASEKVTEQLGKLEEFTAKKVEERGKAYMKAASNEKAAGKYVKEQKEGLDKLRKSNESLTKSINNRKNIFKEANNTLLKMGKFNKTLGQSFASTTSGLIQFGNGLQMTISLFRTLGDESISTGQKLLTVLTMGLPAMTQMLNGVRQFGSGILGLATNIGQLIIQQRIKKGLDQDSLIAMGKELVAKNLLKQEDLEALKNDPVKLANKIREIALTNGVTAADMGETAAKNGATAATKAQTVANWQLLLSMPPVLAIMIAILAVILVLVVAVVAITTAINNHNKALKHDQVQMEQANEAVETQTELVKNAKQAWDDLISGLEDYHGALEAINSLTVGTTEYANAVQKLNEQVLALMEKYPELETHWENGHLVIDNEKEAIEALEEEYNKQNQILNSAKLNATSATTTYNRTHAIQTNVDKNYTSDGHYLDTTFDKIDAAFRSGNEEVIQAQLNKYTKNSKDYNAVKQYIDAQRKNLAKEQATMSISNTQLATNSVELKDLDSTSDEYQQIMTALGNQQFNAKKHNDAVQALKNEHKLSHDENYEAGGFKDRAARAVLVMQYGQDPDKIVHNGTGKGRDTWAGPTARIRHGYAANYTVDTWDEEKQQWSEGKSNEFAWTDAAETTVSYEEGNERAENIDKNIQQIRQKRNNINNTISSTTLKDLSNDGINNIINGLLDETGQFNLGALSAHDQGILARAIAANPSLINDLANASGIVSANQIRQAIQTMSSDRLKAQQAHNDKWFEEFKQQQNNNINALLTDNFELPEGATAADIIEDLTNAYEDYGDFAPDIVEANLGILKSVNDLNTAYIANIGALSTAKEGTREYHAAVSALQGVLQNIFGTETNFSDELFKDANFLETLKLAAGGDFKAFRDLGKMAAADYIKGLKDDLSAETFEGIQQAANILATGTTNEKTLQSLTDYFNFNGISNVFGQDKAVELAKMYGYIADIDEETKQLRGLMFSDELFDTSPLAKYNSLLDNEYDKYYYINQQIEQAEKNTNALAKAKDKASGVSKLRLMDLENQSLEQQISLQEKLLNQATSFAGEAQEKIVQQAAALGVKALFDEYGNLVNYAEIMDKIGFDENAKSNFEDALSTYKKHQKKIIEAQETIGELQDEIFANNYERYTYEVEIKTTRNENDAKRIEYFLGKVEDDIYKVAEAAQYLEEQYDNIINSFDIQGESYSKLQDLYQQGEISQSDYVDGLQEQYDKTIENLEALNEFDNKMKEYYSETLSQAIEEIDKYIDRIEKSTDLLEHYQNLLKLTGHEFDYAKQLMLLDGFINAERISVQKLADEVAFLESERTRVAQELAAADTDVARQQYQKMLDDIDEQLSEKRSDWAEASEQLIERLHERFNTYLTSTFKEIEDKLTGGLGLDQLQQRMANLKTLADIYLDDTNKVYETNKMINQINQAIAKTDNKAAKDRYKGFIDDIKALQNKGQLTKTELELAQSRYKVLQAQIALEEAQNAKSMVRLRRDNQGNFGYVYTASDNQISNAEQAVEDAENAYYNKRTTVVQNGIDKLLKLNSDYLQKIQDLWKKRQDGEIESDEELQRQLAELEQQYTDEREGIMIGLQVAIGDVNTPDSIMGLLGEGWSSLLAKTEEVTQGMDNEVQAHMPEIQDEFNKTTKEANLLASSFIGSGDGGLKLAIKKVTDEADLLAKRLGSKDNKNTVIGKLADATVAADKLTSAWLGQYNTIKNLREEYEKYLLSLGQEINEENNNPSSNNPPTNNNDLTTPQFYTYDTINGYQSQGTMGKYIDPSSLKNITTDQEGEEYLKAKAKEAKEKEEEAAALAALKEAKKQTEKNTAISNLRATIQNEHLGENQDININNLNQATSWIKQLQTYKNTRDDAAKLTFQELLDAKLNPYGSDLATEESINLMKLIQQYAQNNPEPFSKDRYVYINVSPDHSYTAYDKSYDILSLIEGSKRAIPLKDKDGNLIGLRMFRHLNTNYPSYDFNYLQSTNLFAKGKQFYNLLDDDKNNSHSAALVNYILSVPTEQWQQRFDTGGYTGQWGPSGKLAMLHQKEIVLNADDTKNFLQAIDILRSIVSVIDLGAMQAMSGSMVSSSINSANNSLNQNVTIHAEFPNAVNHSEIEQAFDNLVNKASQYANRY